MERKILKDIFRRRLELAERFLNTSKTNLEHGDLRSAVDRAYYAMFHAAHAALALKGVEEPKTHKGLMTQFGSEIIKAGHIDKDLARTLWDAYDMRQKGDYDIYADFGEERVKELINRAREFIRAIRGLLKG